MSKYCINEHCQWFGVDVNKATKDNISWFVMNKVIRKIDPEYWKANNVPKMEDRHLEAFKNSKECFSCGNGLFEKQGEPDNVSVRCLQCGRCGVVQRGEIFCSDECGLAYKTLGSPVKVYITEDEDVWNKRKQIMDEINVDVMTFPEYNSGVRMLAFTPNLNFRSDIKEDKKVMESQKLNRWMK